MREGPEAGQLGLLGDWLCCRDCQYKYPIRDGIPVMLIEEGGQYRAVPLPEIPSQ